MRALFHESRIERKFSRGSSNTSIVYKKKCKQPVSIHAAQFEGRYRFLRVHRSMQLRIFADLPYVWFTIRLTIRDEHVSPHHRSLIVNLTTHLKLNSARAHLAICAYGFFIGAIRSLANHAVTFSFLAAHPVTTWNASCHRHRAQNICENRIANFTFVLDTRVACVRLDIFYRDLLLLPVPCGKKLITNLIFRPSRNICCRAKCCY